MCSINASTRMPTGEHVFITVIALMTLRRIEVNTSAVQQSMRCRKHETNANTAFGSTDLDSHFWP